jgi:type I restriction enzyme, S subunit
MSEWPMVTIGEVAEVFDGPHATPKTVDSGPIFLGIGSLQDGRINLQETRHVTPEDFKTWTRRVKPQADDVVFSYETRLGQAAIIPEGLECCLGRRMGLVRVDKSRLDPRFFLYLYISPSYQDFLRSRTIQGATVDRIALTEFPSFPIPLPPISEQQAIASILASLDDKIDLNRRMNETLEQLARALFKDWFVDFSPTRAKMEGREPYLSPDLWALFPERLDEEGKPEGWATKPLDEIAEFLNGLALQKYPPTGEDYLPVIKIAELRSGVTLKSGRASRDIPRQYVVNDGDILFSWSGSLTHLVWTGGQGALNQHLFKVTSSLYPKWFFYFWVGEHMAEFQTIAASKATTMGHIQRRHLTAAETFVPSLDLLSTADEVIGSLFSQMVANSLESRTLAQTRDLLLPKLMSGELRARDAEEMVSELV